MKALVRKAAPGAMLVLAMSSAAGIASAQALGQDDTRHVDLNLSAKASYDSNVARGGQFVANFRDVKPGDEIYEPRASIDAYLPIGREAVFLSGDVGYQYYQHNTVLNREHINLTGGGHVRAGPCGLMLNGGISRQQSDLADIALNVTKNTQQSLSGGATLECGLPPGFGLMLGYTYARNTNSAPLVPDSTAEGVNAGIVYANSLIGKLSLSGGYIRSSYSNSSALLLPQSGFKQYQATLTLQRSIGRRLSGQASIGYTSEDTKSSGGKNFHGVTGAGELTYNVNPRLDLDLSYHRSVDTSLVQGVDYTLDEAFDLSANYRLSPRISASLGARTQKRQYQGVQVPSAVIISHDETKAVFGSVSLKVGLKSELALDARYEERNANPTLFSYTGYRVGLTASTHF